MKRQLVFFVILFASQYGLAHETSFSPSDSITKEQTLKNDTIITTKKTSLFSRFLNYFEESNREKKQKKFDISFIGGPHYSTDTKLGIGIVASGIYRTSASDSLLVPSNVSLYTDFSIVGFCKIGIRGTHVFPGDRQRINYNTSFSYFPNYIWGVGYDMGNDNSNKSKIKYFQFKLQASWLFRAAENLFAGPSIAINSVMAGNVERPELLNGQRRKIINTGIGLSLLYDTRDNLTAPHRGVCMELQQYFRPEFTGNYYSYHTTSLRVSSYLPIWNGAVFATDLRSSLNFGHPSWAAMALLGNSDSMRGYYEGRYRDKHKIEAQLEIRQHIWHRNGIVVWAGAGTIFNKFSKIRIKHILPDYGIGYRWEFKKNVNLRLDYGFGKAGQGGFIFNINEAF